MESEIESMDELHERDSNIGLKEVNYVKPKLCGDIEKFIIPKYEEIYSPSMSDHPFYTWHNKSFSKERYIYSSVPVHIGEFKIAYTDVDILNVLRCPIKVTGSREIYLPKELLYLKNFIEMCCIYETSFNDRFDDLFAHITVDYKQVKAGETQRVEGWHVDGFQGAKFPIKHEIEHSYLWASVEGTEYCVQPFFISHIDDSKYLIFKEFEKQAREENVIKALDENIYIIDPYMIHRSPRVHENMSRLIIRLTFEYQKLLDPNDTHNTALHFKVPYKYDIRNRLGEYKVELDKRQYGYI